MTQPISGAAKFGYALVLPVLAFIGCQAVLIGVLSGSGSFDGMGVAVIGVLGIPGFLVANCWVYPLRWSDRGSLFTAGLALPAVLVLVEFLWLFGGPFRRLINAAFIAPFLWIWAFVLLLFAPLIVSLILAWRRKPGS